MAYVRMKPIDAIWLLMETPETPMHVGVLAIFEQPDDAPDDYLSGLVAQMRAAGEPVAPWNLRLSRRKGVSVAPTLISVPSVDLEYHFRHSALPAPGGERELGVMVSRLHSHRLDRGRPLWEFHLIEGLEGRRFAFYVKVHRALVDNVNGIPMMLSMLSSTADHRDLPPLWMRPVRGGRQDQDGADALPLPGFAPLASLGALGKAAAGLVRGAMKSAAGRGGLLPGGAPRSTLNRRINAQRRFATQRIELARIEAVARATDSSLPEILVYLCGSSLRRFFKEYNALPDDSLIGVMPFSLQERGSHLPGNAIAAIRVAMGTDIGDPLRRLAAVKASVKAMGEDQESVPEEGVASYVMLRSAPIYASQLRFLEHLVPQLFNVRVTHTPGAEQPVYFQGARLDAIYPMAQLFQFTALSIGFVSYAGTLNIGFTGARDTLPHLQRMAVYFGRALDELEALCRAEEKAQ